MDKPFIQMCKVEKFFTPEECEKTIGIINQDLQPSLESGSLESNNYRTSQTNFIEEVDLDWAKTIDTKIGHTLGIDPKFSEATEGQRYDETQYFKEHCDWYPEHMFEESQYVKMMGQRTWTFMVYLNNVEEGGETFFRHFDRKIVPSQGTAVVWNNLYPDGSPNPFTIHEALPVIKGNKWVITKWFCENENPHHWNPNAWN